MPRPLRIQYENAWYHVMNRGSNHQVIYKENSHRNLFCSILGEIVDKFKIEIHAFCLMDNHYHLLIKTPYANLSKAMRHLDGTYTQRFNYLMKQDGSLFRGRYKSILVNADVDLVQISRYIHLNPVEAKICSDPSEFKWSSYLSYITRRCLIPWLETSHILNQMTSEDPYRSYSDFVMQGLDKKTRYFYSKKQLPAIYGDDVFINAHLDKIKIEYKNSTLTDYNRTKPLPKKEIILQSVINHFHLSPHEFYLTTQGKKNVPRMIAIFLLRQLSHATDQEISKIFSNIKPRSVSCLMARARKLIDNDQNLKNYVEKITNEIHAC